MTARIVRFFVGSASWIAVLWSSLAIAQFPDRNITILVGYPPGGTADRTARVLAPVFERELKQRVIVENRAGGAQIAAARAVLSAKPDGHTLFLVAEVDFVGKLIRDTNLGVNVKDFASVCGTSFTPYILVIRKDAPWNSVDEVIAHLKKNPESLTFGSSGINGGHHIILDFFQQQAGVKILHVPHQGGGPVIAAMLGGQIDLSGGTWGLWRAQVESSKVRPLAVLGAERMKELPTIPSFREKGFSTAMSRGWSRFIVHKDTPPAIINQLSRACEGLTRDQAAQDLLRKSGLDPLFLGASETTRLAAEDETAVRSTLGSSTSNK
jgi:tripartite-type tricarboxylate transporter receptor subunit TctC